MRKIVWVVALSACGGLAAYHPDGRLDSDDPDTDTDTDWDTFTDPDTGTDTDPDTGTDTDPDTDPDTDTDPPGDGVLLITEVVDHAEQGYLKYVEVTAIDGDVDLGEWQVHRLSNGSTSSQGVGLSPVVLREGDSWIIANTGLGIGAFEDTFGESADQYSGIINGNGNDVYALSRGADVYDVYGEIGVDGTGTAWEYTDSVAIRRTSVRAPRPVWSASEWTITPGSGTTSPWSW